MKHAGNSAASHHTRLLFTFACTITFEVHLLDRASVSVQTSKARGVFTFLVKSSDGRLIIIIWCFFAFFFFQIVKAMTDCRMSNFSFLRIL